MANINIAWDSLRVKRLVFHIIDKTASQPVLLDAVDLTEGQQIFFRDQFQMIGTKVTEYQFVAPESSHQAKRLIEMTENADQFFVDHSKAMTRDFFQLHKGNTLDGVLVFALTELPDERKLMFIVKMDYKQVVNFEVKDREGLMMAQMEDIANPIVHSKDAIQKAAIIDVSGQFFWEIMAMDRSTGVMPEVARYFEEFLEMQIVVHDFKHMNNAVEAVSAWANDNKDNLPAAPTVYKERATAYMQQKADYEADNYIEDVLGIKEDSTSDLQDIYANDLLALLDDRGLRDVQFKPDPKKLNLQSSIRTPEGVTISWKGNQVDARVEVKEDGDEFVITIKTIDVRYQK